MRSKAGSGVTRIRDYSYGSSWRSTSSDIKKERGRICQKCGTNGSLTNKIETHHIHERGRGGPDSDANTLVLCEQCHAGMHPNNRGMRAKRIKRAYNSL